MCLKEKCFVEQPSYIFVNITKKYHFHDTVFSLALLVKIAFLNTVFHSSGKGPDYYFLLSSV